MPNETYHTRGEKVDGVFVRDHPLYMTWVGMKQRCNNPKSASHINYGARGITYCARWRKFANFAADMGPKPSSQHSLERVDNNKGYFPENCEWATRQQQSRNRRKFWNNSTGETGVVATRAGRFESRFDEDGIRYHLGTFATPEIASERRNKFETALRINPDDALDMLGRKARYDSTTGVKGVSTHSKKGFIVRVTEDGVRKYLGYSLTLAGAIQLLRDNKRES